MGASLPNGMLKSLFDSTRHSQVWAMFITILATYKYYSKHTLSHDRISIKINIACFCMRSFLLTWISMISLHWVRGEDIINIREWIHVWAIIKYLGWTHKGCTWLRHYATSDCCVDISNFMISQALIVFLVFSTIFILRAWLLLYMLFFTHLGF